MQRKTPVWGLIAACAISSATLLAGPAFSLELITPSEAALPAPQITGHERGISRGPTVAIVSPSPAAGAIQSPLNLKITFDPHGGSRVDADSVLLTYMRTPAIDLTQRIRPYITANGIYVIDAEVPPGTHTLRVDVSDTDGRTSSADFTFSVSK
jgi:hypothetical protein